MQSGTVLDCGYTVPYQAECEVLLLTKDIFSQISLLIESITRLLHMFVL